MFKRLFRKKQVELINTKFVGFHEMMLMNKIAEESGEPYEAVHFCYQQGLIDLNN